MVSGAKSNLPVPALLATHAATANASGRANGKSHDSKLRSRDVVASPINETVAALVGATLLAKPKMAWLARHALAHATAFGAPSMDSATNLACALSDAETA
jgi:hypothetical protein